MGTAIAEILATGLKIFSDERRRYYENKMLEVEQTVKDAENKTHPDYSDAKLALAVEARETFLLAFNTEFKVAMDALLSKVVTHV